MRVRHRVLGAVAGAVLFGAVLEQVDLSAASLRGTRWSRSEQRAVRYVGADPVFVDVDPLSFNIDLIQVVLDWFR